MSMDKKLKRLEELKREAELGGGEERLEAQHAKGKLSARERLELLLDEGSFIELDRFVTHRSTEFGLEAMKILGDGVVTGYGQVNGRLIYVVSHNGNAAYIKTRKSLTMVICPLFEQAFL